MTQRPNIPFRLAGAALDGKRWAISGRPREHCDFKEGTPQHQAWLEGFDSPHGEQYFIDKLMETV